MATVTNPRPDDPAVEDGLTKPAPRPLPDPQELRREAYEARLRRDEEMTGDRYDLEGW